MVSYNCSTFQFFVSNVMNSLCVCVCVCVCLSVSLILETYLFDELIVFLCSSIDICWNHRVGLQEWLYNIFVVYTFVDGTQLFDYNTNGVFNSRFLLETFIICNYGPSCNDKLWHGKFIKHKAIIYLVFCPWTMCMNDLGKHFIYTKQYYQSVHRSELLLLYCLYIGCMFFFTHFRSFFFKSKILKIKYIGCIDW